MVIPIVLQMYYKCITSMKKEKKIKYKIHCFRLNKKTYENLKKQKTESGFTWNRFFYKLLK